MCKTLSAMANLPGHGAGFSGDSFTGRISVIAKAAAMAYISLSDASVIKEATMQELSLIHI